MATTTDPTADPTPEPTPPTASPAAETAPAATEAAAAPPAAPRSGVPKALAFTGVAVGSALLLGLTFAGGVAVGHVLPDGRGPAAPGALGPIGDRGEQLDRIGERVEQRMDERMDERRDERAENRDERRAQFEQWLEEQGIDPSEIPAPPAPGEPTE